VSGDKLTSGDGFEVGDEYGKIAVTPDRAGLLCVGMEGVDSVSTFVGLTPAELRDFALQALALAEKTEPVTGASREAAERRVSEAALALRFSGECVEEGLGPDNGLFDWICELKEQGFDVEAAAVEKFSDALYALLRGDANDPPA